MILTVEQRVDQIRKVQAAKKHVFFENGKLNIVGIRRNNSTANSFDDVLTVCYKDASGFWQFHAWPITTDPGNKGLIEGGNPNGTAILCPGQYLDVYVLDLHQGKYLALCQRNGNVSVWRDADKDKVLDPNKAKVYTGVFGINIHRANEKQRSVNVENWSEGCQVFCDPFHFKEFIELCVRLKGVQGGKFSYTLIDEADLG